jgi:hypothetical protein
MFFGFSTPVSDLIVAAGDPLARLRRLSSGRFGSLIELTLDDSKTMDYGTRRRYAAK